MICLFMPRMLFCPPQTPASSKINKHYAARVLNCGRRFMCVWHVAVLQHKIKALPKQGFLLTLVQKVEFVVDLVHKAV